VLSTVALLAAVRVNGRPRHGLIRRNIATQRAGDEGYVVDSGSTVQVPR
jgi:hypothetical protein